MTTESKTPVKDCFIIMPIADQDGYEKGHFKRVYDHIIKPACKKVGLNPVRADDVSTSGDIVKRIHDSEIAICDLSARNPNVMYELGVRHAFNKPTVLIKDNKTPRAFDIQGIRDSSYDETLRIDSVESSVARLIKSLEETMVEQETGSKGAPNSIIELMGIHSAKVTADVDLSADSTVLLQAINSLSSQVKNTNFSNSSTAPHPLVVVNSKGHVLTPKIGDLFDPIADTTVSFEVIEIHKHGIMLRSITNKSEIITVSYQDFVHWEDTIPF